VDKVVGMCSGYLQDLVRTGSVSNGEPVKFLQQGETSFGGIGV
jgi:hypothetical protein